MQKKYITCCDRLLLRPECLEVVTLSAAFPDLLRRHMADYRSEDLEGQGTATEEALLPELGSITLQLKF